MTDQQTSNRAVYHPLYAPVPFAPLRYLREGGRARWFTLFWIAATLIAAPSGLITRFFELTGLEMVVAGQTLHLTIYLPLLVCLPFALWFGFWWAAIPAYLSSFLITVVSGMPLGWSLLFALANPVGLGTLVLVYRVATLRVDLRDAPSLLGFVGLVFVSAMAGSAGSFIWAHTNQVGFNEFHPVWQGWWLGGFLQALLISGPTLWLLGPPVLRWLQDLRVDNWARTHRQSWLAVAIVAVLITLVAFVFSVRAFGLSRVKALLPSIDPGLHDELNNAIDGLAYSHWIMAAAIALAGYFAYQAVIHWTNALRLANRELEEKNRTLLALSVTDPLTGVFNRRQLFELTAGELAKARREHKALGLLMVDVDRFKRVNDRFGHQTGDRVLELVVERLRVSLRPYDVLGRYGGEEFVLVLPGADADRTRRIGRRLLHAVGDEPIDVAGRSMRISVSIGGTSLEDLDQTVEALIRRADEALFEAKRAGRNQVVIVERRRASEPPGPFESPPG